MYIVVKPWIILVYSILLRKGLLDIIDVEFEYKNLYFTGIVWRPFAIALSWPCPNVELLARRRTFHELNSKSLVHLMKRSTFCLGLSPVSTQLQCCALPVFHSVSYLDI